MHKATILHKNVTLIDNIDIYTLAPSYTSSSYIRIVISWNRFRFNLVKIPYINVKSIVICVRARMFARETKNENENEKKNRLADDNITFLMILWIQFTDVRLKRFNKIDIFDTRNRRTNDEIKFIEMPKIDLIFTLILFIYSTTSCIALFAIKDDAL